MAIAEPRVAAAATAPERARVLVVDDHSLLRTGVANIINQEPDLTVVAEAANGRDAVEAFRAHRPDVVLMDLRMPEMEGVEAVRRIRELDPQARVIVLTTYDADEDIARALQGRRQGLHPQGHLRRRAGRLHPRRARRQDLPGADGRRQAGRAGDAGAAHAARAGRAPPARRTARATRRSPPRWGSPSAPSRPTSRTCSRSSASPAAPRPCASPRGAAWCGSIEIKEGAGRVPSPCRARRLRSGRGAAAPAG